jgi:hypothetical protein
MAPGGWAPFLPGDCVSARPEEGTTVTDWVFAQDKPAAPAAPAAAPAPPPKPDPAGTATGGIADVTAKEAGKPTLAELADFAGHNRVSINLMWTLVAGFLVMFMQAGFALVETGVRGP